MNIIFAVVLFIMLTLVMGIPDTYSTKPIVGDVMEGQPAAKAGLQTGDEIVSIDTKKIETWEQLTDIVYKSAGKELNITYLRNDSTYNVMITPVEEKVLVNEKGDIKTVGLFGISREATMRSAGIFEAIGNGVQYTFFISKLFADRKSVV